MKHEENEEQGILGEREKTGDHTQTSCSVVHIFSVYQRVF